MSTLAPSVLLLMSGANNGDLNKVREALAQGADVNALDIGGRTALMRASRDGYVEVVRFLLSNGAKVNAHDQNGRTALIGAAFGGHVEILRCLLASGADVHAIDSDRRSALNYAIGETGLAESVELLFEAGGTLDSQKISMSAVGKAAFVEGRNGGPPIKSIIQRWLQKRAAEGATKSMQKIDIEGILSKAKNDVQALTEIAGVFQKQSRLSREQNNVLVVYEFMDLMMFDGLDQCLESYDLLIVLATFKKIGATNAERVLEGGLRAAHNGELPKSGRGLDLLDATQREKLNIERPLSECNSEVQDRLIAFVRANKDALSEMG